ncbi:hypothetical protein FKM82_030080 [Ascaphus truei]
MCRDILQPRRAARRPYAPINSNSIKAECEGSHPPTGPTHSPLSKRSLSPLLSGSLSPSFLSLVSTPTGSIRLPKAAKTPLKILPLVRPPLAAIVKELAAQAPLKPKTPRGTKTPINRNQLTQSRGLSALPTKRAYDTVSGVGVVPPFSANGRSFSSGVRSSSQPNVKRQKLNIADAPNPVVFVATKDTR